jgi:hypothetical protein
MTLMDWLIFWLGIGSYVPLIIGVIKQRHDCSQTFTTWVLYFLLDLITMLSCTKIDGSYVILLGFAVGSFIMASILFYQRRFGWTWLETTVVFLVLLCIGAWYKSGPYWAAIFGIISESIVGIHLMIKTYKNPTFKYNLVGYIGFTIVSIVAFLNAKDFNIQQIGYPIAEAVISFLTLIPLANKWLNEDW